ncbi:MAG: hypothetical protein J6A16_09155 [Oscillospiraceae bacterium]|nr:hypothetical protein [Oscillospiraceae bacterium]
MKFFVNIGNNIRNNLKYIIISFIIAVVAWLSVSVQVFPTVEERVRDIVIEVQATEHMLQNNLEIVSELDSLVDIRIEGKRYDITGLSAADFYATLDLSAVKTAGTFTVPVTVSSKSGSECTILDTDPLAVTVQIDEIVTREFPVTATAPSLSLPEGYYVDEFTASPATISVTGSATLLDKIDRIEARSRYSGVISESHDTQSELFIYGTNGAKIVNDDIKLSTTDVSVYIPVYKQKELPLRFEYTNVPTNFDTNSLKFEIQPSTIIVAAPDESIDNLSELVIDTIDLSDIMMNKTVFIPITLPDGYKNLSGNNSARIVWDIADYGKLDFSVSNISIINPPDNYDVSLITNELVLSVIGPSEAVSALTASDFIVKANLLGVSLYEGAQNVPVTIEIRGRKQTCWVSGSYKVTVDAKVKAEEE